MNVGYSLLTLAPGHVGGSESYAAALLAEYASGSGPDEVTVLATREVERAYGRLRGPGVEFEVSRWYRPGAGGPVRLAALVAGLATKRIVPRMAARKLDLVHYALTVPVPRLPIPAVVTVQDLQHRELPHLFSRAERLFRARTYEATARAAARVVTPTEHSKRQLVEHLDVAPERITVAPHGVEHERFTPTPEEDDGALQLPAHFLLYPANMWPHKNHRRLFEAFGRRADRDLKLVLTGRRMGASAPLPSDTVHLGHVPLDRLPALYRRARALIFPSLFEGFGFPVLEAMACGCPVAAGSIPAIEEVAGSAALLFESRETEAITAAIDRIAADASLRERLSAAGRAQAAGFTWERSARAHVRVYAEAAASAE